MLTFDINDSSSYTEIKELVENKEVVVLGPGSSITEYEEKVMKASEGKVVISTNFIPEKYKINAVFISNEKRLDTLDFEAVDTVIATSNLREGIQSALFFNYSSLLGEGDASDNAGAMLIRILKKSNVKKVYLAGFDGFDVDSSANYAVATFKKSLDYNTVKKKNESISKQLKLALNGVEYEVLTPTRYEIGNI